MWGLCSFLLGPGSHKVLFVPSKILFPQFCVSSGVSVVGLMAASSKRAYVIPGLLHQEPLPLQQATADLYLHRRLSNTQRKVWLSLCGVSASWCTQGMFKPSEHPWSAWDLILNTILPLLLSHWGFSFALERGVAPHSNSSAMQLPLQSR